MYSAQGMFQHHFQCKKVCTTLNKIWYCKNDPDKEYSPVRVSKVSHLAETVSRILNFKIIFILIEPFVTEEWNGVI